MPGFPWKGFKRLIYLTVRVPSIQTPAAAPTFATSPTGLPLQAREITIDLMNRQGGREMSRRGLILLTMPTGLFALSVMMSAWPGEAATWQGQNAPAPWSDLRGRIFFRGNPLPQPKEVKVLHDREC